jgi:hypothetical protein
MTNETKIKYEKVYHCIPKIEIDLLFFKEFERNLSLIWMNNKMKFLEAT